MNKTKCLSVHLNGQFFQVKPTGALDYPNLDQAFFRIVGPTNLSKSSFKVDAKQSGKKLQIDIDAELEVTAKLSMLFSLLN